MLEDAAVWSSAQPPRSGLELLASTLQTAQQPTLCLGSASPWTKEAGRRWARIAPPCPVASWPEDRTHQAHRPGPRENPAVSAAVCVQISSAVSPASWDWGLRGLQPEREDLCCLLLPRGGPLCPPPSARLPALEGREGGERDAAPPGNSTQRGDLKSGKRRQSIYR